MRIEEGTKLFIKIIKIRSKILFIQDTKIH